jgi:hypothetical protein
MPASCTVCAQLRVGHANAVAALNLSDTVACSIYIHARHQEHDSACKPKAACNVIGKSCTDCRCEHLCRSPKRLLMWVLSRSSFLLLHCTQRLLVAELGIRGKLEVWQARVVMHNS